MSGATRNQVFGGPAAAFVVVAVAALLFPVAASAAETELRPWQNGTAKTFTLPSTSGAEIALAAQKSRVVLVHFFATWCEPCREELPALMRLIARARADDLAVVPLAVGEPAVRVQKFMSMTNVNFPVLLDEDRAVSKAWKIHALPSTVVLDNHLTPRLIVQSDFDWDRIDLATLIAMTQEKPNHGKGRQKAPPPAH